MSDTFIQQQTFHKGIKGTQKKEKEHEKKKKKSLEERRHLPFASVDLPLNIAFSIQVYHEYLYKLFLLLLPHVAHFLICYIKVNPMVYVYK